VGAAACTACCKAASCKCITPPYLTNIIYVTLMVIGAAAGMALRVSGLTLGFGASIGINGFQVCANLTDTCNMGDKTWGTNSVSYSLCSGNKCKGNWAVYQISFTFMCFFGSMMLFTIVPSKFSSYTQHGHWFLKVILVLAMLISTAFMSPDLFASYSLVARYIAPFFMLYQLIMFIDFGYRMNETLCDFDDDNRRLCCINNESGNLFKKWMLFATVLIYIAIFVGIGFMYASFPSSCNFNTAVTTVTLIFVLLNTGISMAGAIAPHGSILTSALVTGYCTWLGFGALGSMPDQQCNPFVESPNTRQAVVSILVAAFALFLTGWGAGAREQKKGGLGEKSGGPGGMTSGVADATSAAGVAKGEGGPVGNDQVTIDVNADSDELSPASFWRYHLVMTLCSIYMAMLLTNWGDSEDADPKSRYNLGYASAWVQVAANWTCSLIYLWTLIAPWLCKGKRDFGVEFPD